MAETTKKKLLNPELIEAIFNQIYDKILVGIPKVSEPVKELADEYLKKNNGNIEKATTKLINNQVIKCGTSGFVSSLGGIFTNLFVGIPADLTCTIYIQMRMVAAIAHMAGFDVKTDQTRTIVYATLVGLTINGVAKTAGLKLTEATARQIINKIPKAAIGKVNKLVGKRVITKFGTKGIVNLGKMIPFVSGAVGAGLNIVETKFIANRAYKVFILNEDFKDDDNEDFVDDVIVTEETIISEEPIDENVK